ncbi:MAG: copper oxidase, partial [Caldilinea sp. CFX5]|nr:copper oxidase [Caldilinea sp. CFX5]
MTNKQKLSRRAFLIGTAAVGATWLVARCGAADRNQQLSAGEQNSSDGSIFGFRASNDFRNPLAIPPLAPSTRQGKQRVFALTAQAGISQIFPGVETETWGYNGALLGPTLRAQRGEEVL